MTSNLNPDQPLCICYHGTTKRTAETILRRGFKEGTYFAKHLEDAIGYGGRHVFEVAFQNKWDSPEVWQFRAWEIIPPSRIVSCRIYSSVMLFSNRKLRNAIFSSQEAQ